MFYFSYAQARPNETKLLDYLECCDLDGADWEAIAKSLLGWMSDDEVRKWAESDGWDIFDDCDIFDDEEEE